MKTIDYIINKYSDKLNFSRKQFKNFLNIYNDRIIRIEDGKEPKAIGIYLRLTDESLEMIRTGKIDMRDSKTINRLYKENGKNIHFFLCAAENMIAIRKGIKKMILRENPRTISWLEPDMKRIFIRRLICHQ